MEYSILRERWIMNSMPILVQTEQDIQEGFGLVAVFYHYKKEDSIIQFHYVFKVESVFLVMRIGWISVFKNFHWKAKSFSIIFLYDIQQAEVQTNSWCGYPCISWCSWSLYWSITRKQKASGSKVDIHWINRLLWWLSINAKRR